jgi:hypothetical protein
MEYKSEAYLEYSVESVRISPTGIGINFIPLGASILRIAY